MGDADFGFLVVVINLNRDQAVKQSVLGLVDAGVFLWVTGEDRPEAGVNPQVAVAAAAQSIFPNYGYTQGPANFPDWIAFDKRAGLFGQAMWGSYGEPQTLRVRVTMRQVPGSGDIRLVPSVFTVTSAGEAGFEDARPLMGLWSGEFGPILRQISAQASGAGPGL